MPPIRKRRAQAEASPSPPPTRRRRSPSASEASSVDEDTEGEQGLDGDPQSGSSHDQMVKKLVRLALASEYSRQPIRRADITAKVMAPNAGRHFKHVLAAANSHLATTFGMTLSELPQREKLTIAQKRAAQRSASAASSSNAYILTSTLPAPFRAPPILPPARISSSAAEGAYTALYTFVISIISLSPRGTIPESRLERHLKRVNADNYVLGEKTEKVLKRMEREGYIVRVKERDGGGEESVEFVVGPRGKVEVGERGVAGVVRRVYGKKDAEADELERRLVRSLGEVVLEKKKGRAGRAEGEEVEEMEEAGEGGGEEEGGRRTRGKETRRKEARGGRRAREEEKEDEEEDEEEEAEEEAEEEDEEGEEEESDE